MQSEVSRPDISVVVPVRDEAGTLEELAGRVASVADAAGLALVGILFVDDGSTDGSWGVIAALAAMGVAAELTGRNDIVVDGRKISGNAQYASGPRMLSHGTLLLDSRLKSVVEALNVKTEKIASKGLKSIRSRVANISEFLESPVSMADFKARLVQSIFAPLGGAQERPLAESDWRAVHQLAAEKYGSWDWNFGRSPAYNIQRVHRFSLGRIDARVDVAKGRIQAIRIFGDFIGMGEIAELEDRLRGKSYRKDALRAALCEVDLSRYFGDISQMEFLDFLVPN
ncbi:MAG: lipoate--protein ligase [Thermodesulfobacteriota bacterium]